MSWNKDKVLQFKILGITSAGFGVLLIISGFIFKITHWPDYFNGLISGPITLLIGILVYLLAVVKSGKDGQD